VWLDGPGHKKIPALGVPSASASAPHGAEGSAGYSIFRIEAEGNGWRCETFGYQRGADGAIRESARYRIC
jgi:hypothetical protein